MNPIQPSDMTPDPDDALVVYSVRELLAGIKEEQSKSFTEIKTSMSGKADKADLTRIEARLDSHARDLTGLKGRVDGVEDWQRGKEKAADVHRQRDERFSKRTKAIWVAVTTLLLILATALGPAVANLIH